MTTRAALYLRVSSEMQLSGHSLDAQRRALHDACTLRGYQIAIEETDEALSARSDRIELRPGLSRILDAVRDRRIDVLMVHSLDRLARNVMTTLTVFKLLADHGVAFVSLSESIDYATPEGRLQLTILGAFSAYFSDNLSRHTTKGKAERVAQGKHNNQPPFGYMRTDSGIAMDPRTVDAAREMWRLAAEGKTDRQVAEALASLGHLMGRDTVRYLLTNRFFLGEVRHRGEWFAGQHAALVDADMFALVQAHRRSNRRMACRPDSSPRGAVHVYTFGGLLTCAQCGRHVTGHDGGTQYLCWGRRGHGCQQPMLTESALTAQFTVILGRMMINDELLTALVANQPPPPPPVDRAAIERRLTRLRTLYEVGDMALDDYMQRRNALRALVADAPAPPPAADDLRRMAVALREMAAPWQRGTAAERQRLVGSLAADMLVDQRRIVAILPQPAWRAVVALVFAADTVHEGYRIVTDA